MKPLHIISLLVATACTSSFLTYELTSAPKLHLFKPEKVEIVFSQEDAKHYCANYLLNEVESSGAEESTRAKILSSNGFGFSHKEIYCKVSAKVDTFNLNRTITTDEKNYYFSLKSDTELAFTKLNKSSIDDAFVRYKEQFIVN